jgi:hypothetical protein
MVDLQRLLERSTTNLAEARFTDAALLDVGADAKHFESKED